MDDLKQISHEIAQAIFDSIEQDRTLILNRIADVIHKELAVRLPEQKEPETKIEPLEYGHHANLLHEMHKRNSTRYRLIKKAMEGTFLPFPDPPEQTATAVRERQQKEEIEARLAAAERKVNPPVIEGTNKALADPESNRLLTGYEPRWIAWDLAGKRREIP